ncbi:heterokaryon incompatibility protein Het-C-domain-containing protein [Lasiosphaeria miniovina]|uniref:Heterokaryon incompatibility protein Het-C-domain-containing protein n=1 Tax=Lasiosphaeria miniovina TaxID=1954250 RepID=A0AA40ECT1_9PEZI|nr:heterokaryon incompatibility protein Het-C-domain-containing protein [Lasiosphaeria miniovina]KAK0733567.1 heterokaryon incompatibility protein Het-C-domain-containing protein [Lasiosphaeria miniovina]
MAGVKSYPGTVLLGLVVLFLFARPTLAFGAGNIAGISKVEGQNWRHGDIEDALLKILMARAVGGKKFDKIMVSRVYFGNWLRDYSQAIDVGTVKSVSAEAIRLLLCVLGFLTFGYGSREFEVTADRLGCYRPEDHIDNPKNYADNEDATNYDRRLRGPVDERVELAIDPETGMKTYIASTSIEQRRYMTSALHVRRLFTECIRLGRSYSRSKNNTELYEALRLLGTGLHCLEDYLAHSNYVELALIELGERDIFPHVGRDTKMRLQGARNEVYPVVTGTFGGVDFLHSVTGEVSDKMTQSEIQDLEGTLQESQNSDTSILRNLLDKIPDGLFGGDNKKQKMEEIQNNANAAQMSNTKVSPRNPEEFTQYIGDVFKQIMPAIEFHDDLLQTISKAIEKIPVLPKIIEQLEEQLSVFVFSIIAPFLVPVIDQIKNELATGATEIIESSKNEQLNVFHDDRSTDPTHSMLSKDHFSNILNEIAGQTASKVVSWVVPQLMEAWDDHNTDVDRLLNKIIYGVLHHPAQRHMGQDGANEGRDIMFRSVEEWWGQMDEGQKQEYRQKLGRRGVERGENHKEGVHDTGHGCGKKLGMHKNYSGGEQTMEDRIAGAAVGAIMGGVKSGFSNLEQSAGLGNLGGGGGGHSGGYSGGGRQDSSGGGLGGFLGGATAGGGIGGILGGVFKNRETDTYSSREQTEDGGYSETTTEYGRQGGQYGQAEYTETQYPGGGERTEYRRYEQDEGGRGEYSGYEERTETSGWEGGRQEYRQEETSWGGESRREEREEYPQEQEESSGGFFGGGGGGGFLDNLTRQASEAFESQEYEEPPREEESRGWGF